MEHNTSKESKAALVSLPLGVEEGYDLWSLDYDLFSNPMVALVSLAVDELVPSWKGHTVLDLGCGTGRLLEHLLRQGAQSVVGVDVSLGMLEQAQEQLTPFGTRVCLVRDQLEGMWPQRPEVRDFLPADGACITLVLEHFADVQGVLKQAGLGMRPGGWLFVAELHADLAEAGIGAHFERDGVCYTLPSHRHTTEDLLEALRAAGFSPERILEMQAASYATKIPKLARHGARRAVCAILARRAPWPAHADLEVRDAASWEPGGAGCELGQVEARKSQG